MHKNSTILSFVPPRRFEAFNRRLSGRHEMDKPNTVNMDSLTPLVTFVGPTAVGKSKIAVQIAQEFNGEIINADSRQVYRYMDIGTGKPSLADREKIRHHLLDIVDPWDEFSVAEYLMSARKVICSVRKRNKIPIVVGGTGQYIFGLLDGYQTPAVSPNKLFRKKMTSKAEIEGEYSLWNNLYDLDPDSAKKIDYRNVRRVIRALEVYEETGILFSKLKRREKPPFNEIVIGLNMERKQLYSQIDSRIESMIFNGWIEEVRKLLDLGCTLELSSMASLGYREIAMYLEDEIDLNEVLVRIKGFTHRFVRHQYNWFRLRDTRINWVDVQESDVVNKLVSKIGNHLTNSESAMVEFT